MSKKIKIAVNARFLIPNKLEGIGTYSHQVLSRLVKLMPEVEFHFLFDRPYSDKFISAKNVVTHQIGMPARHPFLWFLWFEFTVPKFLKKNNIDLFLSLDSFLSLKSNIDTILVMHDLAFEHFPEHNGFLVRNYYKYFFPKFAKNAAKIIAVSKFTKQDIVDKYSIKKNKIDIGYCGVSKVYKALNLLEKDKVKRQLTEGKDYFICIGSLNPRKNISSAVKAFNLFKSETKSKIKLVIVGANGWKTESLFKELDNSSFKDDIIRTGHLEPEILSKYLAASKGLIFPSFFEGFGIPIVEAYKCNVPVITSYISSTKEIGEGLAILVNPNRIDKINEAMKKVLTSDSNYKINEKLKKEKLELYNWDKTAEKFKEIITFKISELG